MGLLERELAISNLRFLVEKLAGSLRLRLDAAVVLELCARERQLGCALLLNDLDVDGFHEALLRSAAAYLWLLREAGRHPELDTYHLCKSKAAPLLDAVAAGDMATAHEIARHMSTPFQPRMESEEDFHFFDLSAGPLLDPATRWDDVRPRVEEFRRSLDGGSSERFDVVTALLDGDRDGFEAALKARTDAWAGAVDRARQGDALDPYFRQTEAYVFVEGIALARLGAARGLPLAGRTRFIPEAALAPPRVVSVPGFRP